MNRKNKIKAIVALAVALAFFMPGAFANDVGTIGVTSNSENTGDIENIVEISTNSDTSDNAMPLGTTIYVDDDNTEGPWHGTMEYPYQFIQEGVTNAIAGDTVYVYNGTYTESNILVTTSGLNLVGESKEGVIVDSDPAEWYSFKFMQVSNTNIANFTIKNAMVAGICIECQGTDSEHISITNCIIHDTTYHGIATQGGTGIRTRNSIIKNCEIYHTGNGITLGNFQENTISECYIHDNNYGIYLIGNVAGNYIYHNNLIGNTYNAYPDTGGPGAIWDDGYPSGGNYWDDYTGIDDDGDGIGDTPYILDGDEQDRFPLIDLWVPPAPPGKINYTLDITVDPIDPIAGGTVDAVPGPEEPNWYAEGTEVTLTANATTGWTFDHWSGNLTGNANPDDITMDGNKSVTATFTWDEYTLTVTPDGNGHVDVDPLETFYRYGDEPELHAVADDGWTFDHWGGALAGDTNPTPIFMDGNKAVTATFTEDEYTLDITIDGLGCDVDVDPAGPYKYGTVVTLAPDAATGWSFAGWSGPDGSLVADNKITMITDMNVTATFTKGWKSPMNFTNITLGADTVVFGETGDASNGIDTMDVPKPPSPGAPYIYAYIEHDLPGTSHDILWEEYRLYNASNDLQIWDLFVETDTTGGSGHETVEVNITWDKDVLATETQYEHIDLYDMLSGDLLKDMTTVETYEFTADSGMANHFQIICSDNHAPVAVHDPYYETMEAHELNVPAPGILENDCDEDGDNLTAVIEDDALHGDLELYANGSFDYMPDPEFFGPDTFTYKACDGERYSDIATVTIKVKKLNHIEVQGGWNLISMPVGEPIDKTDILVRFDGSDYNWTAAVGTIIEDPTFGWNSGMYTDETTLVPGEGYWMWSYKNCKLLIPSNAIADNHITNLAVAWNLVGIPYNISLEKSDINVYYNGDLYPWDQAVTNGYISDFVYDWDRASQNYALTGTFMPGYGYWMYAYHGCALKKVV